MKEVLGGLKEAVAHRTGEPSGHATVSAKEPLQQELHVVIDIGPPPI